MVFDQILKKQFFSKIMVTLLLCNLYKHYFLYLLRRLNTRDGYGILSVEEMCSKIPNFGCNLNLNRGTHVYKDVTQVNTSPSISSANRKVNNKKKKKTKPAENYFVPISISTSSYDSTTENQYQVYCSYVLKTYEWFCFLLVQY